MSTYVVTGAAGFIGSNLVERLLRDGHTVRGFDNFTTGRRVNLEEAVPAGAGSRFSIVEGDLRDREAVARVVQGADYVLHQAALPSVQRSVDDPITSNDVNISGTLNVLVAARDAGVKRVIYAASSSAYGDSPTLPKVETMTAAPKSPYAVTKLVGEQYCRVFHSLYGLETVCLRYFNVFGPRQDPTSHYSAVIPKFATALLAGKRPVVYGDGEQSRDFTFVANAVDANLLACGAPGAAGQVMNVACGERFTLNELLKELGGLLGVDSAADYEPARQGDVKHSLADISLARELLGYSPKIDFRRGLEITLSHFKEKVS